MPTHVEKKMTELKSQRKNSRNSILDRRRSSVKKCTEPQLKAVKTRLECRSGKFLEVKVGGDPTTATVHGAESGTGSETLFFLIPVGLRVVAIQHVDTHLYIAMNSGGKLTTSEFFTNECKFKENVFENYWCIYSSVQYKHPETQRPWHIGINDKGKSIRGSKAKKDKPASHFLPRPIEVHMMREPSQQELPSGPSRSSSDTQNQHAIEARGENNV